MTSSRSAVGVIAMAAGLGLFVAASLSSAQTYPPVDPPRIRTIPEAVAPNQPFKIAIETLAVGGTVGPWSTAVDQNMRVVEIGFDYFCGWICPGEGAPFNATFYVNLPGLPAGDYVIRFLADNSVDIPLRIAAPTPVSVPSASFAALAASAVLMISAVFLRLRSSSTMHGPNYA